MATKDSAADAAAILREHDPRTPAEQAALDALDQRMWVLWHADNRDAGVVLLLSRDGLLRDKAREQQMEHADRVNAELAARNNQVRNRHISVLDEIVKQAAQRLDKGEDPAEVASWMRERRGAAMQAADRARRPAAS